MSIKLLKMDVGILSIICYIAEVLGITLLILFGLFLMIASRAFSKLDTLLNSLNQKSFDDWFKEFGKIEIRFGDGNEDSTIKSD